MLPVHCVAAAVVPMNYDRGLVCPETNVFDLLPDDGLYFKNSFIIRRLRRARKDRKSEKTNVSGSGRTLLGESGRRPRALRGVPSCGCRQRRRVGLMAKTKFADRPVGFIALGAAIGRDWERRDAR